MADDPLFSIIILTHNKLDYTRACVESILRTEGARYELIVVDNGSTDETPAYLEAAAGKLEEAGARLRVHANPGNVGCCTGRNQGMRLAEGEVFVFMDNDVMVGDPAWLPKLWRVLAEEPRAGFVGPKLVYPFPPHWVQCAGVGISKSGRVQFRGRGEPREKPELNVRAEVQCLISACYMFPRAIYEEQGGLDEAFNPIEFEDFDYCYRARERGWRCFYEPTVEMFHWESITSDGTARLPNTYLIVKHGMLFKQRWRHMFEREDGPPDSACRWRRITVPSLDGHRTR
jgi:GT2 family glycosyltransferase